MADQSTRAAGGGTAVVEKVVNGIKVREVGEAMHNFRHRPELANFQFRARNRWLGAGRNRTVMSDFYGDGREIDRASRRFIMDADEPPELLGTDLGANPVEHLLNALATCMTTTMVLHAASRGIDIESLESELRGDIDVRGFMGIAPDVKKGYRHISVIFHVKTDAPLEQLAEFATWSPVYDVVSRGTDVTVEVRKK